MPFQTCSGHYELHLLPGLMPACTNVSRLPSRFPLCVANIYYGYEMPQSCCLSACVWVCICSPTTCFESVFSEGNRQRYSHLSRLCSPGKLRESLETVTIKQGVTSDCNITQRLALKCNNSPYRHIFGEKSSLKRLQMYNFILLAIKLHTTSQKFGIIKDVLWRFCPHLSRIYGFRVKPKSNQIYWGLKQESKG